MLIRLLGFLPNIRRRVFLKLPFFSLLDGLGLDRRFGPEGLCPFAASPFSALITSSEDRPIAWTEYP